MLASCAKLIDGAIFCVGVASETISLIADLGEKNKDATSLCSKVAAIFFRLMARNVSSTNVAMGMKVCEGAARAALFVKSSKPTNMPQANYEVGAALAGMVRCFSECSSLWEKGAQKYAQDHPDETYPKYEQECHLNPYGKGINTVCTNKFVGNVPFDLNASQTRELVGDIATDVLTSVEIATRAHQMLYRHYRDIEFEPQIDKPPVPILQRIPQPICPITRQQIQEPCRDKNDPLHLFEYQALSERVEQNRQNPMTQRPLTEESIELLTFRA